MKKFIKNNIFGFIIGGIVFGSIGVGATLLYNSNEISYTPTDSSFDATNVKDALDNLYSLNVNTKKSFTLDIPMAASKDSYSIIGIQNSATLQMHYDAITNTFTFPANNANCWYDGFTYFINVRFNGTPVITYDE